MASMPTKPSARSVVWRIACSTVVLAGAGVVVAGQQGVHDLGKDRVFVPDDTRKQGLTRLQPGEQVAPDLVPDGAAPKGGFGPAAVLQFTESAWFNHGDSSRDRKTDAGCKIFGFKSLVAVFERHSGGGEPTARDLLQLRSP